MRGKDCPKLTIMTGVRITPAYAGKRAIPRPVAVSDEDHPRICGEKDAARRPLDTPAGSPPHLRGKAQYNVAQPPFLGITPAYAGKSRKIRWV